MKKRIAFIAPLREGGPKILYRNLVALLSQQYPEYEYFLVSSAKEYINLHFYNKKYDLIISSVPFLWKPPQCTYIIQQHGLYRNDRGFISIPKLLAWLYPYNAFFSKLVLYPSNFSKDYYNSSHKNQEVILNFSDFLIFKKAQTSLLEKTTINLLTVTGFDFYNKAQGLLDIFSKLENISIDKKLNFYICGDGVYLVKIKKKLNNYKIPKNINIEFVGKISKQELSDIYKISDVFLYSSFQDTFGISIIEAMSMGLPVILNNYDLFYTLYDHNFIATDNVAFESKLTKLICDSQYYQEYVDLGYKNLQNFDKKLIVKKRYEIIKNYVK